MSIITVTDAAHDNEKVAINTNDILKIEINPPGGYGPATIHLKSGGIIETQETRDQLQKMANQ